MTIAASTSNGQTRLEQAQDRVATALVRLENVLSKPSVVSDDNQDLIESLRGEIESLRADNARLRTANESAQDHIKNTINRLNLLLGA